MRFAVEAMKKVGWQIRKKSAKDLFFFQAAKATAMCAVSSFTHRGVSVGLDDVR